LIPFVIAHSIARLLPHFLRRMLRAAADAPSRQAYRRDLESGDFRLAEGGPALNFGAALPSEGGALLHGGKVKLAHLNRAFPESRESWNILYLVSSAIQRHALELVDFARSRGVKFVWNQNGVGFPGWAGGEAEDFNGPMRKLRSRADFIVYQSRFCQESADRFLGPAKAGHAILFNPVDLAMFRPAVSPPDQKTWRLLAAGTHMESERVTRAIETLEELRRRGHAAELTIAGRFRWRHADEEIADAIERANVMEWTHLRPAYSQAEAVAMLHGSHLLLHLKYHDPCPTAVIEAMACGVPVIGSHSGGLPELLGAEGGELLDVAQSWDKRFYPGASELADAVEKIMAAWQTRSSAARVRAEAHFDHQAWVQRHREIFEKALKTGEAAQ
jgi:glycosyltransferase involved in cell wall biosynthesis